MNLHSVHVAAFMIVIVNWMVFAAFFLLQKKPPRQEATRRERISVVGIVIQGLAYAAVWMLERPRFTSIVPLPGLLELVLPFAAVALSIGSVWLTMAAIRTLGKEWSYEARLVEGHRLLRLTPAITRDG